MTARERLVRAGQPISTRERDSRVRRAPWLAVGALIGLLWVASSPAGAATLKADYRFQNTRASSVAGAPALTDVGPGGANVFQPDNVFGQPQQVLAFPIANGLSLAPTTAVLGGSAYSIVMLVRLELNSNYNRLIDFANNTTDNGLYEHSGTLVLYPDASGSAGTSISANQYVQIALTRDAAGTVMGYINRTPVLGPYDDSTTADGLITADNVLRFFIDDTVATPNENSAGAVARIRIYDGPLSAAEVAALAPAAPPPPPPVQGSSVDVKVVSGRVLVKQAGQTTPQPLTGAEQIRVGSTVDTTQGRVRLTSAANTHGKTQTEDFYQGAFRVTQKRGQALTTLTLSGGHNAACPHAASADRGPQATTAAHHPRRRLWGSGHGSFGTRGSSASATSQGTIWLTEDDCEGTLISVRRGVVLVHDFGLHKALLIRAPHSYFAARRK